MHSYQPRNEVPLTRRQLLSRSGTGLGMLGLAGVLSSDALLGGSAQAAPNSLNPLAVRKPHFEAKAKHFVHLFMNGGPSHVDTFDPKPMLTKYDGKELPTENLKTERRTGAALGTPFKFKKYGKSGIEVSELFSNVAESIDEIAVIRSMRAEVPNHEPSLSLMNSGDSRQVRPAVGSWLTYGLGSENQNLPGFIVMCPGGYPIRESANWRSAFLPGAYQGTHIDTKNTSLDKLIANIRNPYVSLDEQRRQLDLLKKLNEEHLKQRTKDAQLESRIQSYELAYRMQMDASDAFDISKEPKHILDLYGSSTWGKQLLITRRLIEKGVRTIQLYHGQGQPWDSHDEIAKNHKRLAGECDQAIGGFLKDLKQRGMLEETLVLWGGEFGRTPVVELPTPGANQGKKNGRDHNHHGFTVWLAGGGVKGGTTYGSTDEFGFKAVENEVHVHDLHATILHLLGFDHEKLTYKYAGREFRLTDVHGHVVQEVIA